MERFRGTKSGEWVSIGGDNMNYEVNIGEAIITIHRYQRYSDEPAYSREEMEANAKLIATAPELLEIVIEMTKLFNREPLRNSHFQRLAIEKAESLINKATKI